MNTTEKHIKRKNRIKRKEKKAKKVKPKMKLIAPALSFFYFSKKYQPIM